MIRRLLDQNRETDVVYDVMHVLKQPKVSRVYVTIRIRFIGTRSFFWVSFESFRRVSYICYAADCLVFVAVPIAYHKKEAVGNSLAKRGLGLCVTEFLLSNQ